MEQHRKKTLNLHHKVSQLLFSVCTAHKHSISTQLNQFEKPERTKEA